MAQWTWESARRSRRRRAADGIPAGTDESPPAAGGDPFPAFDLGAYHPIGCPRAHDGVVGSLGPWRSPPSAERGEPLPRPVDRADLPRLRRLHHLRDRAEFHSDARRRAALLARLAAAGVVVHVADEDDDLRARLGAPFHRLARTDPAGLDDGERELHSAHLRRAALRFHSTWGRARPPPVSILLPTRRPAYLEWALANVARQSYPETELVLGLHGAQFDALDLGPVRLPPATQVVRIPADRSLGGALRVLSCAANGALLAKMDDDDLYGPDHLWDLVIAREFSGAELVGKWLEYLFLAQADCTIQWWNGESERYQRTSVAGGALLLGADTLAALGGWRDLPGGLDGALTEDLRRAGGKIYRTHGAGYLLVRHGRGHTWNDEKSDEKRLLARADRVWTGFDPGRAGLDPAGRLHPALAGRRRPKR